MGDGAYAPLRDATTTATKFISTIPSLIPHRIRRKFRSTRSKIRNRASPSSNISSLQTSLSPIDTINALRTHQWSAWDAQYLFLASLGIFTLCVAESPGPLVKFTAAMGLMGALVIPATRQFFLPFLPIITWLTFFFSCRSVTRFSDEREVTDLLTRLTDSSPHNTVLPYGSESFLL